MAKRHKSAVKRHKQNVRRAVRNTAIRSRVRHVIREVREAVESKDAEAAEQRLRSTVKTLTKAVSKHVLHRNNASRRVSRLAKQVSALKSS